MCYPAILNIGQMIVALQSGKYDLSRTKLLMPTAGDGLAGFIWSFLWGYADAVVQSGQTL